LIIFSCYSERRSHFCIFTLKLTGTPLQNSVDQLFSVLNFADKKRFHERINFIKSFGQISNSHQADAFHCTLSPYIFPCAKEDFERSLPFNVAKKQQVANEVLHSTQGQGKELLDIPAEKIHEVFRNSHFTNADSLLRLFRNPGAVPSSEMALVVEELEDRIQYPPSYSKPPNKTGILHQRRRPDIKIVHIILMSQIQIYHIKGFDKHCHYSIRISDTATFEHICATFNLKVQKYSSLKDYNSSVLCICNDVSEEYMEKMHQIYDALPRNGLKKRNYNWSISAGYTSRMDGNAGGPPKQTTQMMRQAQELLPLLLGDLLCQLSYDIAVKFGNDIAPDFLRNVNFAQQLGANFGLSPWKKNIFEGVDCSIRTLGDQETSMLTSHCDSKNDWRPGYNYCSVIKAIIADKGDNKLLSVIAYTRKDIGDYIHGGKKL